MKTILALIASLFFAATADAQQLPQIRSGSVLCNPGAAQAPATDCTVTQYLDRAIGSTPGRFLYRGTSTWLGSGTCSASGTFPIWNGTAWICSTPLNPQSGNYTITSSDCNSSIYATGTLRVITLPAVSGFLTECTITVINGNTTRAQALSGFPSGQAVAGCGTGSTICLYPRQSVTVTIASGAWVWERPPGIWLANGATVYQDPAGSDTANDGLASSSPLATLNFAWNTVARRASNVGSIQLVCSGTHTENVVLAGTPVGQHVLNITGNSGTPTACPVTGDSLSPVITCTDGCRTTIDGAKISGGGGSAISVNGGSVVDLKNINIGACGSAGSAWGLVKEAGTINWTGALTWSSATNCTTLFQASASGAQVNTLAQTVTVSGGVNLGGGSIFTVASNGVINAGSTTFSGSITSATQYSVSLGGVLVDTGVTYPTGTTAGSVALTGCVYGSASTCGFIQAGTTVVTGGNQNDILYIGASSLLARVAAVANGVLSYNGSAVPVASTTLPSGLTAPSFTVTTAFTATGLVGLGNLASQAANTSVANVTNGAAIPTAAALPAGGTTGCSGAAEAARYTAGTGWGCNTAITASAVAVGNVTGLGTGVATYLASPTLANLAAATTGGLANFITYKQVVDFNVGSTDTQYTITLPAGFTRYIFNASRISAASASLTTATIGIFTGAGGTGTAIVADQAITVSSTSESTANNAMALTAAINASATSLTAGTLYVRVGTPQGSAATGTVTITIIPIS